MRHIKFPFRATTSVAVSAEHTTARKAQCRLRRSKHVAPARTGFLCFTVFAILATTSLASAETRPRYGGTLRVMMQSSPNSLELPANPTPAEYWDLSRTLSLIADPLVRLDAAGRPHPELAMSWLSDASARHWQLTLRPGVKFHDGATATPALVAQIIGAHHPEWNVKAGTDSLLIDCDKPMPDLLAELALPRNFVIGIKQNAKGLPVGTGPFLVSEWNPGRMLKLVANEESWAARPFLDSVEIEFGRSLRDQAIALELGKVDLTETSQTNPASQRSGGPASTSLPVELVALIFPPNSSARDVRLRQAIALAIDRKPMQTFLLLGAGEVSASVLPNWMTGCSGLFSTEVNVTRSRALIGQERTPILNLSYDPTDPHAQHMAERIALNAHEAGITLHVSLSGTEDIRLVRIVLSSPAPFLSLAQVARQAGVQKPDDVATAGASNLEQLYRAEKSLIDGYTVIPLFHLPVASAASSRVQGWRPDRLGGWGEPGSTLADAWLASPPVGTAQSFQATPQGLTVAGAEAGSP